MKDNRDPQKLGEELAKWKHVYPHLTFSQIYDYQMLPPEYSKVPLREVKWPSRQNSMSI